MILYFVRHGESEANLLGEFSNGLNKHPLTEKGVQQVYALAHNLKSLPITDCYSSPILRAKQTAEIISTDLGIPCHITDALREFDIGILEGKSDENSWQMFWHLLDSWLVKRTWEMRIEGGESFLDIQQRFIPFIESLVHQFGSSQSHILLVGHNGTYRCMLPLILHNLDFSFASQHSLSNAAVVIAKTTTNGLTCLQWENFKFR